MIHDVTMSRRGAILGWASVSVAEARQKFVECMMYLSEAGYEPTAEMAGIIDDVVTTERAIIHLCDTYGGDTDEAAE